MGKLINYFASICFVAGIACTSPKHEVRIIIGKQASKTECLTAEQLKNDIISSTQKSVKIITDTEPVNCKTTTILLGTPASNSYIAKLVEDEHINVSENFPGKRGGIQAYVKHDNLGKCIVLSGSDIQGVQYAVYDYSKSVLGVDPLAYWTGVNPTPSNKIDLFNATNKVIPPPEVPILCYFENDVDELANLKEPFLEYDWESYTEMINSLVRLKYNAIHLFDMLGRPEFFLRDAYKKMRPDYDVRETYIDSLINYAHDMGMMVAIDFSLGYKIRPMEQEKADCWTKNKQEWINTWKYYFEETPLSKADIITLRPRNQVWDWPYKSACGEDNVKVFNEVYTELDKVILQYKPEAIKVVTCYTDGMEMFNNGFNPPKDWIIAWCDDGWGGFEHFPESTKGYGFGAYMHAGFWLNHTVHDPYPEKIDSVMEMMKNRFGATKYYEINGQQFRPFLMNLEAFAKIAENIDDFDSEEFYKEWTTRYFGEAAPVAIKALQKLHDAQYSKGGYVQHLGEVKNLINYLKPETTNDEMYNHLNEGFETILKRRELLNQALAYANEGYAIVKENKVFYHDYIILPIQLYIDLLDFQIQFQEIAKLKNNYEYTGDVIYIGQAAIILNETKVKLNTLINRRITGDQNTKWTGWYYPSKRRPNNGFPDIGMLEEIENTFTQLTNKANN